MVVANGGHINANQRSLGGGGVNNPLPKREPDGWTISVFAILCYAIDANKSIVGVAKAVAFSSCLLHSPILTFKVANPFKLSE